MTIDTVCCTIVPVTFQTRFARDHAAKGPFRIWIAGSVGWEGCHAAAPNCVPDYHIERGALPANQYEDIDQGCEEERGLCGSVDRSQDTYDEQTGLAKGLKSRDRSERVEF